MAHHLRDTIHHGGGSMAQVLEMAGPIETAVRKQRETDAGA